MKTEGIHNRQQPSGMPFEKYLSFHTTNPINLPDRTWPNRILTHAPRYLSTDLRDGNQSLIEPMDPLRKRQMFDLLVQMGFKEIEIGFPAASKADFDFARSLVDDDAIPEDVTISVLTQSRPEIIARTIEALEGMPRATVHLYNATSPLFRRVVFHNDKEATLALAVSGAQDVISRLEKYLGEETVVGFEYSPEFFVDTEPDFALEVCSAVMQVWQPDENREIIFNLPTTVERCTPNTYADQVEYFCRHIPNREFVCVSAHNHNDRGTGVATSELALLAGADRVEGCLFGHGERTGNVDLATIALNLYSQGIDPQLHLHNLDEIRSIVEHCTSMNVPVRTPYSGDLVYTSFSGSHQDAIKKGFEDRAQLVKKAESENAVMWNVPYLPIDPKDVGRSYEAVVRVNSQSGKGGVAYLMKTTKHLDLPRRMQLELSSLVQRHTDTYGGEIGSDRLWNIFVDEYLPYTAAEGLQPWGKYRLISTHVSSNDESAHSTLKVTIREYAADGSHTDHILEADGNGPIDAFVTAIEQIGPHVRVLDYAEHALSEGRDATAAAYVECHIDGQTLWGCGIDPSTMKASFKAIVSALNRALR